MNAYKDVEVLQLIRTSLRTRGKGQDGDPIRLITEYWTMDGELVFEIDPCQGKEQHP